jgi:hypothetical protein
MNRAIRGAALGGVGLALLVLGGCENNEGNVKGTGVTPPGAAATSEEGAKVAVPQKTAPPPGYMNQGYGAKAKGGGGVAPRR